MHISKSNFYVVGIGASAGGLDAIQTLFDHVPSNTGMAFIIVQHLSPDFKSLMPELLSKHTSMPIYTAEDKQVIKPNCIYLNQRNKNLHIKGNQLYLLDKGPKNNLNLPIDIFFHTLGEEYNTKSMGVILSGTGSDGSRGIHTIKEQGGTIIVQDPISAQFDGMPNSAIATNLADFIAPPEKIAELIHRTPINNSLLIKNLNTPTSSDNLINNILTIVFKFSGIDFREYKKNTLIRRLEKRMSINNIDHLFDYVTFLSSNVEEKQALKEDFLIGVTRFFRDTEAFSSLKTKVIPKLCESKQVDETVRIWIAGCSTGEEVYSIAILLDDYIKSNNLNINFKIFGTDIDPRALTFAGLGMYNINISNEIDKKFLDRYFIKIGDKIQIIKTLREKIVFSNHNLIKDPPFIRMDLISCRNLLIYFDTKIQKKVMHNFQFALNQYAYLFLGNSESLGTVSKHFKTIDVKWKIFQNISSTKQYPSQSNSLERVSTISYKTPTTNIQSPNFRVKENPELVFHKYLSKKFSPASIFIDKSFNILFIKGDAGKRLSHNEGLFQNNLLKIVNTDIAGLIRSGIRRLESENQDIIIKGVINKTKTQNFSFDLKFHKPDIDDALNGCYLIEFTNDKVLDKEAPVVLKNIDVEEVSNQRLEDLENELKAVKTELQNAIEELETSNEELQSSNEELMASNEELQSTNEELQSVNEELYTVNSEMQEKNKELTNLSNDVTNLLDNTEIATLFLDTELRIRKFTPALKEIFNLHESDYGRPLSSFTSNFLEDTRAGIIKDSSLVLEKLITIEKQLSDKNNNYYLFRASPFITSAKKINGIVITLNNINKLKETEKDLKIVELRYKNLFQNLNEGFLHGEIITNNEGQPIDWIYLDANPTFEKIIGLERHEFLGKRLKKIAPYIQDDPTTWIKTFGETALSNKEHYIKEYSTKDGKHYQVHLFCPVKGEFAATFANITELKNKKEELAKSQEELYRAQEITHVGSWYLDLETGSVRWTRELYKIYGFDPNLPPPNLKSSSKLFTKSSWKTISKAINDCQNQGIPYNLELEIIRQGGTPGWLCIMGEAVKDENNTIIALKGAVQDITQQKLYEEELIKAKKEAEIANLHKNYFLANMSHEIRTPMNSVLGFSELLKNDSLTKKERLKYLEIIDGNSKQLLNLIDDIIDVAKMESNEIKLVYKECHVPNLIDNLEITYNQLNTNEYKKDITFKTVIPDTYKDLVIITDSHRLQQVLLNLLNNALKFSDKGEISFGFEVEEDNIKFFVKDQGIGIKKEKQIEIFERFKQINYQNNAKYGGTGLGLAICKGIITLMGGNINVSSNLNLGTTFSFSIPLKLTQFKNAKKPKLPIKCTRFLKDKTILIAEDDALIQLLFKVVLKNTGAYLLFAKTGTQAVNTYQTTPEIDVVLLDIRMPEMNGIDALSAILEINPKAKVIMQTAYTMPEEKEKCFNKGCVDFLSKPVIKDELFKVLNKWISK
ncbi:chemotaxis protein CheB [Algibacter pectinivorans]|uniref:Two-component system, chemotaxis family, CheB/CheR fusion protein n=1 Tax=Algibacter pectinivorans TaxID=870482 RepID=A0A1I1NVJ7_9FLAO|nr:chemotaxis protein CheB [Algibacter pectinivorans]SFC98753.1 two-component system, chemotaxis family, CheB/CheR fusion protein [Algibacter pectinivorans]